MAVESPLRIRRVMHEFDLAVQGVFVAAVDLTKVQPFVGRGVKSKRTESNSDQLLPYSDGRAIAQREIRVRIVASETHFSLSSLSLLVIRDPRHCCKVIYQGNEMFRCDSD